MKISVIGLGKLGAPLAACLANRGHVVIGVDHNEQTLQAMQARQAPVAEPGLAELIAAAGERVTATADVAVAVNGTEISFVVVPTPSKSTGAFSLKHVRNAVTAIGQALRRKDAFHVVVITSTVMPGDCAGRILKVLEQSSGKKCGQGFGLCYNPEFIALGSVINDLYHPDFALIGESDQRSGDILAQVLDSLHANRPPLLRTSFANAELAKLAVNTFVTTKISFANMLGELCENLPGSDVDAVSRAVGMDSRIGAKYLKAGLGYGGPCFPRDNLALAALAKQLEVEPFIPRATDQVNLRQLRRLWKLVRRHLPPEGTVGILGLTYKPDTPVVEKSQGFELAQALLDQGTPVVAYDPWVRCRAAGLEHRNLSEVNSVLDCAGQADVLVICNPCKEFTALHNFQLPPTDFRQPTIIDCWRLLDRDRLAKEVRYIPLGRFIESTPHGIAPPQVVRSNAAD